MPGHEKEVMFKSAREKFLGLSLKSTRKSYYPLLRQQLERSKENERRLQLLIDSMPARICYIDRQERYVLVNSAYERDFGIPCHQIVGRRVESILGEENYANVKEHIRHALDGNQVQFEASFKKLDNEVRWFSVTYVPDRNDSGSVDGFYVLSIDTTDKMLAVEEKLRWEEKIRQVQKHEAISTLAGGIAHDFNNLLMGVQGRASLMIEDLEASHPHREHLKAMEEYVRSAMNLTRQLLGFARGGKYEVKPADLNELVANSASMFGRTRKEISIHKKMESSELVVDVDRRQIEQVLLNIFVNAWQAMVDGGDLFLETRILKLDEDFCKPYSLKTGAFARLSVTDTGCGMDEDTRQRVFDPFFTTKEKTRGTGLGLASAFGIIQNHGGLITVYSEVGQGTTFNIYLPLSEKPAQTETPVKDDIIKGSETILLVDDEDMIIEVGRAMLETLGYRPLFAFGGKQAIEIVKERGAEIDLVILDLVMPVLDGGRTFDLIRELQPRLPVLLSSGYAISDKANDILQRGCSGFIQKPFNLAELSQKIRMILD